MRMRTIKTLRTAARWIQRIVGVRMPMDAFYGVRTRD